MRRTAPRLSLLLAVAALGCRKESPTTEAPGTPSSAGTAAASSTAPVAAPAGPRCIVEREQSWSTGANLRTGITDTVLADGRLALGFAQGNRPLVLVVDAKGNGELVRPALSARSPLATEADPKVMKRDLQRVTPASAPGGGVRVFADYRDKWEKEERRRIVCGPADDSAPLFEFDGKPLLDVDTSGKDRVAATAPPAASAVPAASTGGGGEVAPVVGDAVIARQEKKREIRDCRSVVDPGGERAFGLASELYGEPHADGAHRWYLRLVAEQAGRRTALWSTLLGKEPKKLHTFENTVARRLEDGSYLVAARYQGALYALLLTSKLERKGAVQVYRGGYPTIPRLVSDGGELVLLGSHKLADDRYGLTWARVSLTRPSLPATLSAARLEAVDPSLAEPNLVRVGDARWLSVQAGPRQSARLVLVPVDERLSATGAPLVVKAEGNVQESRLFALGGGKLFAVWLGQSGAGTELTSATLSCAP